MLGFADPATFCVDALTLVLKLEPLQTAVVPEPV